MKFALATGLLSGSLPVISANAVDTTLQGAQSFLLRNTNGATQGNSLQSIQDRHDDCDPSSKDPDVGVLSCGQGRICLPKEDSLFGGICESEEDLLKLLAKFHRRRGGGALMNLRKGLPKLSRESVECDPTADPDVGILSCASSETCVPSTSSSLGGLCASSIEGEGRRLQDLTYPLGICDPTSSDYLVYDCDCTGLNNETGSGVVTCTGYDNDCLDEIYPGCDGVCVSTNFTYTYVNNTVPTYTFCGEALTPYSQVMCFNQSFVDNTCTIGFNGDPCTSCEVIPNGNYTAISFDCSNTGSIVGVSYNFADILPIVQTCSANASETTPGPPSSPSIEPTPAPGSGGDGTPSPGSGGDETPSPGSDGDGTPAPGSGGENLPSSGRSTRSFATTTWLASLGLAVAWTLGHIH